MRYALSKTYYTGQRAGVSRYGDVVWEWVCDTFRPLEVFTLSDVSQCPHLQHLAESTRRQVARAILHNVIAEYADTPDTCPIERQGVRLFRLT